MVQIPTQTFYNLGKEKQDRIIDAAITEFSIRSFNEAKLSEIIKNAKIPRGSFYQYFNDKKDLYKHIFDLIGQKKIEYMTEDLRNPMNLAFFDLFRELYQVGLRFALDNPRFIRITSFLIASKDEIYKDVFENNIQVAVDFYKVMITRDQAEGRMDKNIDPDILAELVINMTMNVTFHSLDSDDGLIDFKKYEEKIEKIIYIFEKGIKR